MPMMQKPSKSLGYKDAFVVSLNNGSRIKLSEARTLQVNFTENDKPSNNSNNELITLKIKLLMIIHLPR